jgi:DMSO/TMAO reductase YedYZ heme-binding membrane subunit
MSIINNILNFSKITLKYTNILLVIFLLIAFSYGLFNKDVVRDLREIGELSGTLSALIFAGVLMPGITKRFNFKGIFKDLQKLGIGVRAHLGVLMFLFTVGHFLFMKLLLDITYNRSILDLNLLEIFGSLALFLCIPLAFTSNTYFRKKLKKKWNYLHSLVYIIVWFIFLHLLLVGEGLITLIIGFVGILEITSLIYYFIIKKKVFFG